LRDFESDSSKETAIGGRGSFEILGTARVFFCFKLCRYENEEVGLCEFIKKCKQKAIRKYLTVEIWG
jgi:hypothetical protein